MFGNIQIVLVRTFHPGNIGSVARAMKTMGLSQLTLVSPREFPSHEANRMAAGAEDLVDSATVVSTIAEAVDQCHLVIASSVRPRDFELPVLNPAEAAELIHNQQPSTNVALLLGPERMGLHNDDLRHARYRVEIPANPEYPSLNLAAAAQILCYEILKTQQTKLSETRPKDLPSSASLELLHEHLERVLRRVRFLRPHEGETLDRLRNFLHRAEPETIDVNILRGFLAAVERHIDSDKP